MPFQILRIEYDCAGNVAARQTTKPVFEFDEDALALAEFDACRAGDELEFDPQKNCWRTTTPTGGRLEFCVEEIKT
ncbi:hypothetical protein [Bradyrhizobium sp. Ash2021]|uniref:hypothetical protein n=1 Tax=Bradyrhizobium sp. Ash2021 TaxID=2954771 RepID=UPI002814CC19|nr:hypothetical protein [Bradyrhizobium sp. Ash2021]WMT79618.1 hypothetical protein NL528_45155 [Bradyrhizobium sp. Ash2021]